MNKIYRNLFFYFIVYIITYLIYIFPFEIINYLIFNNSINVKLSIILTLIFSILIIFYFRSYNTFFLLKFFVYEGMGIGFISFFIVNIALIISYLDILDKKLIGILVIFIIILVTTIGLIYGRLIFVKNIKISSKKIKHKINFIFISDVHLGTNSLNHMKNILDKISNTKYDFILIGGDLLDSSSFDISKLIIFKNMITKPIYFVTGNHEYYLKDFKEKLNQLKKFNVIILDNENASINNLNIIGLSDNQNLNKQYSHYLKLKNNNLYNLLLVHKSSIWDNVKNDVDLMLSGHCHNGQIIFFKLFVRFQFKYIYGLYKNNISNLYITSGSSCWGPRIRVGTTNEIVHFLVYPDNKK